MWQVQRARASLVACACGDVCGDARTCGDVCGDARVHASSVLTLYARAHVQGAKQRAGAQGKAHGIGVRARTIECVPNKKCSEQKVFANEKLSPD